MATINHTRANLHNQKKSVCVATAIVDITDAAGSSQIATSGDVYELFVMPVGEVLITSASIFVETASNAATSAVADLGFAGGDTLIDGVNLKSAANTDLSAGTNAVVPQRVTTGGTVTLKPVYAGTAATVGRFHVRIEYIELDKKTGELTNYSASA
jgi:hypothetical protein